ncbi:hypothetical protein PMSD_08325 [Paenibacillus macquariensis subsp. defensor]|nr:hypothetical protein PMSD_08325 [Paenibacillus macquariensis subsp. defensor]
MVGIIAPQNLNKKDFARATTIIKRKSKTQNPLRIILRLGFSILILPRRSSISNKRTLYIIDL